MTQKSLLPLLICLTSWSGMAGAVDVTIPEKAVVGKVGSSLVLPCTYSTSVGSDFVLEWKFAPGNTPPSNGRQIYYYSNGVSYKPGPQADRLRVLQDPPTAGVASISLSDIRPSDNGSYACEVNNPPDFSGTGSGILLLTVLAPPSSASCQKNGNPTTGTDLTLQCSSSGGNPTPIFSWTFMGSKTPLLPGMMENQRTGSLLLTNLSQALSGSYRCTASNELGQATCDISISVTSGVDAGAVAGAVVGVLLALLLIGIAIYFLYYRRRKVPNADYPGNDIREDATSPRLTGDQSGASGASGTDSSAPHAARERRENAVI